MGAFIPGCDENLGQEHRHARVDGLTASLIRSPIQLSDEGSHSVAIDLQGVDAEGGGQPRQIPCKCPSSVICPDSADKQGSEGSYLAEVKLSCTRQHKPSNGQLR
jgi:hypothetical protein